MATYAELRGLMADNLLRNKVEGACIVAADAIRIEGDETTNHANRLIWAKRAFTNPGATAKQLLMAVLAANKALTVAAILGATDEQIQTNVDAAVDVFADGS